MDKNTSYTTVCFQLCGSLKKPNTQVWWSSVHKPLATYSYTSFYIVWLIKLDICMSFLSSEAMYFWFSPVTHVPGSVIKHHVCLSRHLLSCGSSLSFYSWFPQTTVIHLSCPLSSSDDLQCLWNARHDILYDILYVCPHFLSICVCVYICVILSLVSSKTHCLIHVFHMFSLCPCTGLKYKMAV